MLGFNNLSLVVSSLIITITFVVAIFAKNYLSGDEKQSTFYIKLISLSSCLLLFANTNSPYLLALSNLLSNLLLASLMIHKSQWRAAKIAGIFTAINLGLASTILLVGLLLLKNQEFLGLILIIISASIQCSLFPFHKWLLSSLNSPTPVSAFMHAGLINGGGLLLVKHADLLVKYEILMLSIFAIGSLSAFIGGLTMLIKPDIKSSLACSTMGQMGFMFMQCGLGLFPLAIAHMCWHGFYKAYLFLSSASAINSRFKKDQIKINNSVSKLAASLFIGCTLSLIFSKVCFNHFFKADGTLIIQGFVALSFAQVFFTASKAQSSIFKLLLVTLFYSALYTFNVLIMEIILGDSLINHAVDLTKIHLFVFSVFAALWLMINSKANLIEFIPTKFQAMTYIKLVNLCQSLKAATTKTRGEYKI